LDFTKFISILEEIALYYSSLSRFTNPLEGFLTNPTIQKIRDIEEVIQNEITQRIGKTGEQDLRVIRGGRKLLLVSSWHMNEYESTAMWSLCFKRGEGVAIQSTIVSTNNDFSLGKEKLFKKLTEGTVNNKNFTHYE